MTEENQNQTGNKFPRIQERIYSPATICAISHIIKMNQIAGRYEGVGLFGSLTKNSFAGSFAAAIKGMREELQELDDVEHIKDIQEEFADVLHYVFHLWHLIDLHQEGSWRHYEENGVHITEEMAPKCQAVVLKEVAERNIESKFTPDPYLADDWHEWWTMVKNVPCEVIYDQGLHAVVAKSSGMYETLDEDGEKVLHSYHDGKFLKNPKLVIANDFSPVAKRGPLYESDNSNQ